MTNSIVIIDLQDWDLMVSFEGTGIDIETIPHFHNSIISWLLTLQGSFPILLIKTTSRLIITLITRLIQISVYCVNPCVLFLNSFFKEFQMSMGRILSIEIIH